MHVRLKKWGNGAAVRIPAKVMADAGLQLGQTVEVREEGGRIIIEPTTPRPVYDIEELVCGITPENAYGEDDFGARVGKEVR